MSSMERLRECSLCGHLVNHELWVPCAVCVRVMAFTAAQRVGPAEAMTNVTLEGEAAAMMHSAAPSTQGRSLQGDFYLTFTSRG